MGAGTRSFVDHPEPGLFQLGDPGFDALDHKGDVVESFAPLVQKSRDRARRVGGFQQLEPNVADPEKCDPDFLAGDLFDAFKNGSEDTFIKRSLSLDGANRDSNMIDALDHHCLLSRQQFEQSQCQVPILRRNRCKICRSFTLRYVGRPRTLTRSSVIVGGTAQAWSKTYRLKII